MRKLITTKGINSICNYWQAPELIFEADEYLGSGFQ